MANPDPLQLHPGARRIIRLASTEPGAEAELAMDHWLRLGDDDPLPSFAALPVLVSLARGEHERAQLDARAGDWGVWLSGDAAPELVAPSVQDRPVVAIEVAKFTDGRHYTLARLLRERYAFTGELRAFGNVLPDQLFYMRRCGYTSFELDAGKSLETGLRLLSSFSVSYQGGADDPRPLYRRRA